MKRLAPAFAIMIGCASACWAATPGAVTTLQAIHALSNEEAGQSLPVAFEATVTYCRGFERTIFVQDGDVAIYIRPRTEIYLAPGDRVLVKGITQASFHPSVNADSITVLHHGTVPKALPSTFDDMIRAQHDAMLVTVRGVVRAADVILTGSQRTTRLQVIADGGYIEATVDSNDPAPLKDMLDAEVEITGIAGGLFDGKMQQKGILMHVSSLADVKVIKRASASPWTLPVTPMDRILASYHVENRTQRVRIHGTITYYQPGLAVVLQSGSKSMWIMTQSIAPLHIGDLADAIGFADVHDGFLALTQGEILDSQVPAPIMPSPATWRQLVRSNRVFDLVSTEGQVVTGIREFGQDEYVLMADGHLFSAIYRHPDGSDALSPMRQIPVGSKVRVSGICVLEDSNPFDRNVPFNILLRSPSDMAVIAEPSWLNITNLVRIVSVLLLLVIAVSAWGWTLDRKVRRQTAALAKRIEAEAALERRMAQLEQRRSRILEDINGSRPLAEIIEQITEMVSFWLNGAPSWCEIADGARLGNHPPVASGLRIIREEIPARTGPALGTLYAGLDPLTQPASSEPEALSAGTRLATLAIETRRLYSDLLHRSEFDLLTDIHNRFSLEKHLEGLIDEARLKAGIFGLIYIDLDEFKQVNDLYGHQVGDQYLQEVALRMKRQLRSHDLLARLGGDEFAVLVPMVRNRADAQEIVQRLESSFDKPFAVEGAVLQGTASVGVAIYPEDGDTKDSLLSAADAAMYVAKHIKKLNGQIPAGQQKPDFRPE
ncbi:MAG: GGDEF domain-containing protein [Terracidiphilus sp.]|jgi:diguanylate cyclase (GGDEF)-like protein